MGEKKEKSAKSKIEIQTRKPEKRGIFANLGSDRSKNDHPLREILNFPPDLDSHEGDKTISKKDDSGYPPNSGADIHSNEFGYPTIKINDIPNSNNLDVQVQKYSDIQKQGFSFPDSQDVDIQTKGGGNPDVLFLDIQPPTAGYPPEIKSESKISKEVKGISNAPTPDSKISKTENLDSQISGKKGNWRKYEKNRSSKGVFLRTNDEITKKFKQFCIANDWDFSQGTELAWNKLMNDLDSHVTSGLDSLIAQDDRRLKMMFKTKVFIINLYLRYNSIFNELSGVDGKTWNARWSPRDDETAQRYNEVEPAIIELGILQTQIQKGFRTSRIQTFKYYTDEIEKVLASGVSDAMLETILNYHRQIWKNQTGREVDLEFLTQSN